MSRGAASRPNGYEEEVSLAIEFYKVYPSVRGSPTRLAQFFVSSPEPWWPLDFLLRLGQSLQCWLPVQVDTKPELRSRRLCLLVLLICVGAPLVCKTVRLATQAISGWRELGGQETGLVLCCEAGSPLLTGLSH